MRIGWRERYEVSSRVFWVFGSSDIRSAYRKKDFLQGGQVLIIVNGLYLLIRLGVGHDMQLGSGLSGLKGRDKESVQSHGEKEKEVQCD